MYLPNIAGDWRNATRQSEAFCPRAKSRERPLPKADRVRALQHALDPYESNVDPTPKRNHSVLQEYRKSRKEWNQQDKRGSSRDVATKPQPDIRVIPPAVEENRSSAPVPLTFADYLELRRKEEPQPETLCIAGAGVGAGVPLVITTTKPRTESRGANNPRIGRAVRTRRQQLRSMSKRNVTSFKVHWTRVHDTRTRARARTRTREEKSAVGRELLVNGIADSRCKRCVEHEGNAWTERRQRE
jgi:hypothetical protein